MVIKGNVDPAGRVMTVNPATGEPIVVQFSNLERWVSRKLDKMLEAMHLNPKTGAAIRPNGGWRLVGIFHANQIALAHESGPRVIVSGSTEEDGKKWWHVSVSREGQLPTWDDLKLVKKTFMGPEVEALMKFPRESEYVNHHPFVLHLWQCLDGDVTPDFRTMDPNMGNEMSI